MKKGSMAIEIVPDKEDVQLLEADVVPVNIADRVVEPSTEKDTEVVRLHSSPNLVLQFSPTEEEVAWLKKSMVAVGCLEEFFKCNSDLVESWFEWIHPTSLSTMPSRSRMVWLRFAGVPLKAWSGRCFTGLGALLGEVILVNEDTKSKSFLSEGRVLILSDMQSKIANRIVLMVNGSKFSDDGYDDDGYDDDLNVARFSGEDDGNIDEEFAGEADKSREMGIRWVTARTRSRKERRKQLLREEKRQDFRQASASLSDCCIKHRNRLIRRELELEEVRRLFELGKRLGIECQNNQDEVMSRLVSLEERDTAGFEKA
ncbi:hypothetical protein SLEP1_g28817 [Rubroshorea leprosula]|uniref:DUF4283 domain-containing protein n=1 Tax=Rubroshorea leprosula TaxID=152421 RepID=A0AAV5K6W5_9ROSI|nr:hypothetical protein SLEP1_g28817 [Rubroshorea leprosula]